MGWNCVPKSKVHELTHSYLIKYCEITTPRDVSCYLTNTTIFVVHVLWSNWSPAIAWSLGVLVPIAWSLGVLVPTLEFRLVCHKHFLIVWTDKRQSKSPRHILVIVNKLTSSRTFQFISNTKRADPAVMWTIVHFFWGRSPRTLSHSSVNAKWADRFKRV